VNTLDGPSTYYYGPDCQLVSVSAETDYEAYCGSTSSCADFGPVIKSCQVIHEY
jgi:hypothetical protein